ncbi:MAG TPA: nucleoside monophosphate kinase [bacterium]|nr:nucleoside monophosphate kinase [bacterium]
MDKVRVVLLFGPQSSGKGTQGMMLEKSLGIPHISTGRLLRVKMEKDLDFREKFNSFVLRGDLVPDQYIYEVLFDRLQEADCQKGFILDGYPRNLSQIKAMEKFLGDYFGSYELSVVNLLIPFESIVQRVSGRFVCSDCGQTYNIYLYPPKVEGVCDSCAGVLEKRADDQPEIIKNRYEIFNQQTVPVLDYYQNLDNVKIFNIDGEQTIDEIFKNIMAKLND